MSERRTRAVTREISIAASIDAVWKALTEAEELTRWFPPRAAVEPGEGGRLWRGWQSGEEVEERIDRWEVGRHLRTTGLTGAWSGIVTDYSLTTDRGVTVLRVVSSGFGEDASWDDLYDAFGGGWDFELRGLKHYLEQHIGVRRRIVLARSRGACTADESWDRLIGARAWLGVSSEMTPGESYEATLPGGRAISGVVMLAQPPRQFAATVREFNDAYLRIDTRCLGAAGAPWIWLSTYGLSAEVVIDLEADWQSSLDALFANQLR